MFPLMSTRGLPPFPQAANTMFSQDSISGRKTEDGEKGVLFMYLSSFTKEENLRSHPADFSLLLIRQNWVS